MAKYLGDEIGTDPEFLQLDDTKYAAQFWSYQTKQENFGKVVFAEDIADRKRRVNFLQNAGCLVVLFYTTRISNGYSI